jgi:hypothetical protein
VYPSTPTPTLESLDQPIEADQEIQMNNQPKFKFSSTDTVLNALVMGGMAVGCAVLVVVQGVQAIVA